MIGIKHPKLWAIAFIGVILCIAALFYIRYGKINDPKTAFRVKEVEASYGQPSIEVDEVLLTVDKPVIEKIFDEEYQSEVFVYKIPFTAQNISMENAVDFDESNLQIVSGGQVRVGWPWDSYDDAASRATNWKALKPGETTGGYWTIEVVKEEFPDKVYEDYDLYYVQREGNTVFKNRFV